jgi:hypothetical protein
VIVRLPVLQGYRRGVYVRIRRSKAGNEEHGRHTFLDE